MDQIDSEIGVRSPGLNESIEFTRPRASDPSHADRQVSRASANPRGFARDHETIEAKTKREEMNLEDERRLKFDRRLVNRRGWVSSEELSAELARLEDASDKIAPPSESEKSETQESPQ